MEWRSLLSVALVTLLALMFLPANVSQPPTLAQDNTLSDLKPFILPVAGQPGPDSWFFGQPYGNSVGAYNFGRQWYAAGQGLHFGIDFPMPCGTELVAVGDGVVVFVDNFSFGSRPHNLLIRHPQQNVVSLYGHLLETPDLQVGQQVEKGQLVGLSGDPDETCDSRPHLHFELRTTDYSTALNPVEYIDAPWHMLASIGGYSYPLFQQDLTNARRWISVDDQPNVTFRGQMLNAYRLVWPLPYSQRPPASPLMPRDFGPLPDDSEWEVRQFSYDGCCSRPTWNPDDPDKIWVIDGVPNEPALVMEWSIGADGPVAVVEPAPMTQRSPDGTLRIFRTGEQYQIQRLSDGETWWVQPNSGLPSINTDNTRILWETTGGTSLPGQPPASKTYWVSDIEGRNSLRILTQPGGSARWLDANRILIEVSDLNDRRLNTLRVFDVRDSSIYDLGTWLYTRGVSIAPGGDRLMFYLAFQEDSSQNGVYIIETRPGAEAQKLPWFGAWRWRDAESVFYIPYQPTSGVQTLMYYHIPSGTQRQLTNPEDERFMIANGEWAVSPDGNRIVFQDPSTMSMWLLEDVAQLED